MVVQDRVTCSDAINKLKKAYRDACRTAVNQNIRTIYNTIDSLYQTHNIKGFWNKIRSAKKTDRNICDNIKIDKLLDHFHNKFSESGSVTSELISASMNMVNDKYRSVEGTKMDSFLSQTRLIKAINKLRLGCAPGIDGITAEHIKYDKGSNLMPHICNMLSLCIHFGTVPDIYKKGLLIPIPKKSNIDMSLPKSYRPVTISVTFSKLLEIYILEECGDHTFHDLQFGFIENRGTSMAVALSHDITDYFTKRGSTVFSC